MVNEEPSSDLAGAKPARPTFVHLGLDATLRNFWLVGATTLIGTAVGLFLALIKPNEYQSTGKLLVRPGLRDMVSAESAITGLGESRAPVVRDLAASELQVIVGEDLFRAATELIGVKRLLEPYDPSGSDNESTPWQTRLLHNLQAWWFKQAAAEEADFDADRLAWRTLEEGVRLIPEAGSNVIVVDYVAHDAKLAQEVVHAVLEAAKEIHRKAVGTAEIVKTAESESAKANQLADDAEETLRKFKETNAIFGGESERAGLQTRLDALDQSIAETITLIGAREGECEKLKSFLVLDRPPEPGARTAVVNPEIATLNTYLNSLDLERFRIESQRGILPKEQIDRQLELVEIRDKATRAKLATTKPMLEMETSNVGDARRLRLDTAIETAEVALSGLRKQQELRISERGRLLERVKRLEGLAPQMHTLERDAMLARQKSDGIAASLAKLRDLEKLDQLNLSNLKILHPASFDPDKIGPKRTKSLFLGAFLGFCGGAALAFGLRLRNRRVIGAIDLRLQGLQVHGSVVRRKAPAGTEPGAAAILAEARDEVAQLWSRLPFDRRTQGLSLAFLGDDPDGDTSRVAGVFAAGLALHGGERVAYVCCRLQPCWLEQRFGAPTKPGRPWGEYLDGRCDLAAVGSPTAIHGLTLIALGGIPAGQTHPMQSSGFAALIERLCATNDFVILDVPPFTEHPEGRAVLRMVDIALIAARIGRSTKAGIRDLVASTEAAGATMAGAILIEGK